MIRDLNLHLLETNIFNYKLTDNMTYIGLLWNISKPTGITGSNKTLIDNVYLDISKSI